jgi:hypothetical protein
MTLRLMYPTDSSARSIYNVGEADLQAAQKEARVVSAMGPSPARMEGAGRRPLLSLGASIGELSEFNASGTL